MNRIENLFQRKKKDILNIYFTAGYPELDSTGPIIRSLEKAGVDLIEVGMPYSDPLADGPTIQQSGQVALRNGMTLEVLFEQIREVRQQTDIPLILMGYFNQVMQYGEQAFFHRCAEVGIDGLILPDLPLVEYEAHYREMLKTRGLSISFLITPQTPEERIRKIDALSRGFVYMVADASITGAKSGISTTQEAYFQRIAAMDLRQPRLIGFGIASHESFRTACNYANGAIIGSAFIKALRAGDQLETSIEHFIQRIKSPTHDHSIG